VWAGIPSKLGGKTGGKLGTQLCAGEEGGAMKDDALPL